MRALAVLAMMFWVSCPMAQDAPFRLIGTSGKSYSAVANALRTWVEDGLVHGFAQVQVQDAPGSRVVWEFQFIGCESGRGTAVLSTCAAATTEPVS